ncbi:MAG TPA: hypothetical protein QGF35_07660 [Dehalococcoidia bacterium]|nr:hypothetical protein [Dehalococcoidia bacterium]
MLTHLDDTLLHQMPMPFDHASSSDYRFFDRYWFSLFDTAGSVLVVSGMGLYKNMNVLDGFGCATHPSEGRQYNVRVSRQLQPDLATMGAGPLRYEVLEPLKRHRLVMGENDRGLSFDLEWEAVSPPHEEGHHFLRRDGRVVQDYHRFDQMGRVSGWVRTGGQLYEASKETWVGVRDHSWGVRPGVGGVEVTTSAEAQGRPPGLFNWLCYHIGEESSYFAIWEEGDGSRVRLDSSIRLPEASEDETHLRDVEHELEFYPGTRRVREARYRLTHHDGRVSEIRVTRVVDPFTWVLKGYGYGGYKDGKGLGVYRGRLLVEGDTWDVSDPEVIRDEDGEEWTMPFREGPVRVEQDGQVGFGHYAEHLVGPFPRYGFRD